MGTLWESNLRLAYRVIKIHCAWPQGTRFRINMHIDHSRTHFINWVAYGFPGSHSLFEHPAIRLNRKGEDGR